MYPVLAKLPIRIMALAPHCSQTRKPKLNWHKALVRDDSANQHGAWIPTYICLPRAQTGSTVSRCPQRRKLRPREGVWDSSPGAASISCTKIICRHREGSRSCSCPDTVWDPVLQLPAPTPGNEAVGHQPRGGGGGRLPSEVRLDLVLKGSDANALEATCSSVGGAPEGGTQSGL